MIVKTKRVRRANRTYEYLVMVESVRINGKNTHRRLSQNPGATLSKVGFGGAGGGATSECHARLVARSFRDTYVGPVRVPGS